MAPSRRGLLLGTIVINIDGRLGRSHDRGDREGPYRTPTPGVYLYGDKYPLTTFPLMHSALPQVVASQQRLRAFDITEGARSNGARRVVFVVLPDEARELKRREQPPRSNQSALSTGPPGPHLIHSRSFVPVFSYQAIIDFTALASSLSGLLPSIGAEA